MRMRALTIWGVAAVLVAMLTGLGAAHHGWSGYDSSTVLNLTGTIRESGYEHPHGYIRLAVPEKTWLVILAPPSRMENRGLPRQALSVGTTVSVVGYPHRSQRDEMRAENLTFEGKTVELR
jgi:hypothetical protein